LEKWQGKNFGGDLYEYFVNARHPALEPVFRNMFQLDDSSPILYNTSYLGYTTLILTAIGLARRRYRRKMIPWLLLLFPFLLLRLGSVLTINGEQFPEILLPKRILDEIAPGVFIWAFTYNGTVPGPRIVVHEGDYVELTLVNLSDNELVHNVDFHASIGALGGGQLTLVAPGEEVVLDFRRTHGPDLSDSRRPGGSAGGASPGSPSGSPAEILQIRTRDSAIPRTRSSMDR